MEQKIKCEVIGLLNGGGYERMHDIARRVYGTDGLAPTMHTCGGGNLEPKILEPKVKVVGNYSPSGHNASSVVDTNGIAPTVMENHGTVTAITEPLALDEQNGYIRQDGCAGTLTTDGSSPKHNNRVVEPILVGGIGEHDFGKQNRQGDRVYDENGIACALNAQPLGNAGGYSYLYKTDYRIRKLTEKECFRLQSVKGEDFEKVAKHQSTSSLYHLAGDSINCTCLMAIFGELFSVDYQDKINSLTEELENEI